MEQRRIGSLSVSVIGLGGVPFSQQIDERQSLAVIGAALDSGINFIDTSDTYGDSEVFIAKAIKARRDKVVIATKFGYHKAGIAGGARPAYIAHEVERSLQRLGVDCIDLYQLHEPDPKTPIADTLAALNRLVEQGKVREIGCTRMSSDEFDVATAAVAPGAARFVSMQSGYNLLDRSDEAEIIPLCERLDVAYLPIWPLAAGLLSGKYRHGAPIAADSRFGGWDKWTKRTDRWLTTENFDLIEALDKFAKARGHTLLDLSFAWLLALPITASVLVSATTPEQIAQNASAADFVLSREELDEVNAITHRDYGIWSIEGS